MCEKLAYWVTQDLETGRETIIPFDPHIVDAQVAGEMILGIGLSPRWIGTTDAKWDYFTPETDDFIGGWDKVGGIRGN